jgi:hypothetical protein
MRSIVALVGASVCAGLVAGGHGQAAERACGRANVQGATVITYCGPAKATFTFAGKTYKVSGGGCSLTSASGITAWTLLIGKQTLPPAKPKFLSLQAVLDRKPKAGSYRHAEFVVSFELPGASWTLALGLPHSVTITAGGTTGSFTGSFYTGSSTATKPASGSWTC